MTMTRILRMTSRWSCRQARHLRVRQEGMSMIEYGVLAAFIVVVMAAVAVAAGPKLRDFTKCGINEIIKPTNSNGTAKSCAADQGL